MIGPPLQVRCREVDYDLKDWEKVFLLKFSWQTFPPHFAGLLLANHLAYGAPSPPAKKVLLLYAYPAMMPAIFEWDEAIRTALKGTETQPVEFYTEFLNLVNFPHESYVPSLLNLLTGQL